MTTSIEALITEVLVREGWPKYTNDPADHGGPTKGGVTLTALETFLGHPCTAANVQNLTEEEVRQIYRQHYVGQWHFDQLIDPWVQNFVVDTGILQGQAEAAKMLQAVLQVPQDGTIGPTTLASLSLALVHPDQLRKALISARLHLLLDDVVVGIPLVQRQTTNLKWRHGWVNRVLAFL